MKKTLAVCLLLLLPLAVGCGQNYGTLLEFNGGELYYTSSVTEDDATRLGQYLVSGGFFDGDRKSVQLTMAGSTYQFRMVIKEGLENDQEYVQIAKQFNRELSVSVFGGKQVDIHFCNEQLKTIRVIRATDP
ncbi:MAG: hypothetical protein VB857_14355 [Pirellulaceae bacterium]